MRLPKLNKRLLRRIKRYLLAEPRRYDQDVPLTASDDSPCGTQGCILGWAVLLSVPENQRENLRDVGPSLNVRKRGAKVLGLSWREADAMFSPHNQKHSTGRRGVREACQKIDSILKDRSEFVTLF